MKKLFGASAAFAMFALLLTLGCNKDSARSSASAPAPAVHHAAPVANAVPREAAAPMPKGPTGTIQGVVLLNGQVPKAAPIDASADPACSGMSTQNPSIIASDGKLANVLVRIEDAELQVPAPTAPVKVDQTKCSYSPRVQGAVVGQRVEIHNGDMTLHNVHSYENGKSLFNNAQPPGTPPLLKSMPKKEGVVTLKCDVHPWMRGYVVFNDNPYFDTTGANGSFSLAHVPVGHYTLEAWQEKLGTKTVQVDVKANQVTHVSFTYLPSDHS